MTKIAYRSEIDGLRAIAVISVILYHVKFDIGNFLLFKGGFVGVDIFFVISGYLISKILLVELKTTNRISIISFYIRRARRLLPVLFFILSIIFVIGYFYLLPSLYLELSKTSLSVLFFFSNIYFLVNEINYGNLVSDLNPLLHAWTLSLEEQFYIIFPFILIILNNFFKKKTFFIIIFFTLVSFASGILINYLAQFDERLNQFDFYLLPFRAWELLLGSVAALLEIEKKYKVEKIFKSSLSFSLGLLIIFFSIIFIDLEARYLNLQLIFPCIGTFLIIISKESGCLPFKLLTNKNICFVGLISYSLYLWHFPIISLINLNDLNNVNFYNNNYLKILYLITIFLLSSISYFFVEKPFRNKKIFSNKLLSKIIIFVFLSLIFISLIIKENEGLKNRFSNYNLLLKNFKIDNNRFHNEWRKDLFKFYSYSSKENLKNLDNKQNVLIIGNSFAVDYFNLFNLNKDKFKNYNFFILRGGTNFFIENYMKFEEMQIADIIILGTKFDSKSGNLSYDESFKLIKDEINQLREFTKKNNKKLIIFLSRPEFSINAPELNKKNKPLETLDFNNNYTYLDKLIHQKILKKTNITKENFEEWSNKYFLLLMKDKIDLNTKLKKYLKKENILFFNPFDYACDFNKKKCLIVDDKYQKIYFDYGHYTLEGAEFFGKIINEDFLSYR